MKQIIPINEMPDGTCRTLKSQYCKVSGANLIRQNTMGATGVLEMEEARPIQVAQIYDQKKNPINGRVYSQDGIAPTLRTPTGGLSEPKIMKPAVLTPIRTDEQRELRKQGIDTFGGRQMLPRTDGVANTITTVQKDNLLQEPCIIGYSRDHKGNVQSYHEKDCANTIHTHTGSGGNTDQFVREMVIGSMQANAMRGSLDGVSPCLTEAMGTGGGQIPMVVQNAHGYNKGGLFEDISPTITSSAFQNNNFVIKKYRIRKLTPRECFRLMGMDDADIDKIDAYRIKTALKDGTVKEKPIPKSQKYKMAGNSIVVDVLYNIFYQMFIAEPPKPQPKQLSLFEL